MITFLSFLLILTAFIIRPLFRRELRYSSALCIFDNCCWLLCEQCEVELGGEAAQPGLASPSVDVKATSIKEG